LVATAGLASSLLAFPEIGVTDQRGEFLVELSRIGQPEPVVLRRPEVVHLPQQRMEDDPGQPQSTVEPPPADQHRAEPHPALQGYPAALGDDRGRAAVPFDKGDPGVEQCPDRGRLAGEVRVEVDHDTGM